MRAVDLRLRADELVEQLARAVLLSRLAVCLPDRERLPERPAVSGCEDNEPCERRGTKNELPLLLREVGLAGHSVLLAWRRYLDKARLPVGEASARAWP